MSSGENDDRNVPKAGAWLDKRYAMVYNTRNGCQREGVESAAKSSRRSVGLRGIARRPVDSAPSGSGEVSATMGIRELSPLEGEKVIWISRKPFEVRARCDGAVGHWFCVSHQESFRNNLQANSHVEESGAVPAVRDDRAEHIMVWICAEHGPEAS